MFTRYGQGYEMNPSQRIRMEWPLFKGWCAQQRAMSQTSIKEMIDDARRSLVQRSRKASTNEKNILNAEFDGILKSVPRQAEEGLTELLRQEWGERLGQFGLRPEDWNDKNDEEQADFEATLGGDPWMTSWPTGSPSSVTSDDGDSKFTEFSYPTGGAKYNKAKKRATNSSRYVQPSPHVIPPRSTPVTPLLRHPELEPQIISPNGLASKMSTMILTLYHQAEEAEIESQREAQAHENDRWAIQRRVTREWFRESEKATIDLVSELIENPSLLDESMKLHQSELEDLWESKDISRKTLVWESKERRRKAFDRRCAQRTGGTVKNRGELCEGIYEVFRTILQNSSLPAEDSRRQRESRVSPGNRSAQGNGKFRNVNTSASHQERMGRLQENKEVGSSVRSGWKAKTSHRSSPKSGHVTQDANRPSARPRSQSVVTIHDAKTHQKGPLDSPSSSNVSNSQKYGASAIPPPAARGVLRSTSASIAPASLRTRKNSHRPLGSLNDPVTDSELVTTPSRFPAFPSTGKSTTVSGGGDVGGWFGESLAEPDYNWSFAGERGPPDNATHSPKRARGVSFSHSTSSGDHRTLANSGGHGINTNSPTIVSRMSSAEGVENNSRLLDSDQGKRRRVGDASTDRKVKGKEKESTQR